jgi:hypothetical protein
MVSRKCRKVCFKQIYNLRGFGTPIKKYRLWAGVLTLPIRYFLSEHDFRIRGLTRFRISLSGAVLPNWTLGYFAAFQAQVS